MAKFCILFLSLMVLAACQTAPTQVYESVDAKLRQAEEQGKLNGKVVKPPPGFVLIDARPAFEYSLSHINGSLNIRWDEFTQSSEPYRGMFEGDLFYHARRLARLGIGPDTPVIVVGRGQSGFGEEGRLAWTLKYLGVTNVQFMSIEAFERPRQGQEAPPPISIPIWRPLLNSSILVDHSQFREKLTAKKSGIQSVVLLDVRPADEFRKEKVSPLAKDVPEYGAVSLPWTDFITPYGLPKLNIKQKLIEMGITQDKEIVVLSNRGVESATVTLTLQALGYLKAANYAGGYSELLAE